ncbi:MAG: CaiB/BaiF CoA transferase family protein [Halobacteriaceae archaeon]
MARALDDLTVVSFAQLAQGPVATQFLGDMGADVVKIEPPGGEWMRSEWSMANAFPEGENATFLGVNRNKRSVELDLKDEDHLAVAYDLVEDADVVVENFRPGVMERLGLGYEELSERNPGLVYASATGFGSSGPYADRPGQDLLIQGVSGLAAQTGRADDPPTPVGTMAVDFYAAMNLAASVLAALHYRERTGEGQKVEGALLNAAVHMQAQEVSVVANAEGAHRERSAAGIAHPYFQAPYGVFETADGHMTISLSYPADVADVLGIDGLADVDDWESAYDRRDEIKEVIESVLRTDTTDHWLDRLGPADIWCAPVKSLPEAMEDPQVRHNDMVVPVEHPVLGEIELAGVPVALSETPGGVDRHPPTAGEHTDEVLEELGYDPEELLGDDD